jgi:hypothetical protein
MEMAFRQGNENSPSEEVEFLRKRAVSPKRTQSLSEIVIMVLYGF